MWLILEMIVSLQKLMRHFRITINPQIVQNIILKGITKSRVGFQIAQLQTRQLSPNSLPRHAHNFRFETTFKRSQITQKFVLTGIGKSYVGVRLVQIQAR